MNNDMEAKLNNHIHTQKNNSADNGAIKRQAAQKTSLFQQENVSNSIKNSLDEFLKNPELVESYIDFCDSLVNEGYKLEHAIDKTDKVFNVLKNKDLYD